MLKENWMGSFSFSEIDVESAFKTVEEYGLSPNEPDFLGLIRKSGNMTAAEFDAKVKEYVLGKVKPPKPANPADVVQPPATAGARDAIDVDALAAEQSRLMKEPTKHYKRLAEIRELIAKA